MKESFTTYWTTPNTGASNISGFTGLPGGSRAIVNGMFTGVGSSGIWWSSTTATAFNIYAGYRSLSYNTQAISVAAYLEKPYGFSVRCLRD